MKLGGIDSVEQDGGDAGQNSLVFKAHFRPEQKRPQDQKPRPVAGISFPPPAAKPQLAHTQQGVRVKRTTQVEKIRGQPVVGVSQRSIAPENKGQVQGTAHRQENPGRPEPLRFTLLREDRVQLLDAYEEHGIPLDGSAQRPEEYGPSRSLLLVEAVAEERKGDHPCLEANRRKNQRGRSEKK